MPKRQRVCCGRLTDPADPLDRSCLNGAHCHRSIVLAPLAPFRPPKIPHERYVVIDLDFDSAAEARSFQGFLTTQMWANPENSPGLAGTPESMVLEPAVISRAAGERPPQPQVTSPPQ